MAFNCSIWLRETARLYLRYMAVGLTGAPLVLLYAWAKRADWNMPVVTGALILLGLVGAFSLWRRLGEWQIIPAEVADVTSDAWAELVNAAIRTTVPHQQIAVCFQQSMRADEEQIRAWNLFLSSAVASPADVAEAVGAALKTLPAGWTIETEQEQHRQSAGIEDSRQRQPAWASTFKGQTQTAHGLA